MSVWKKLLLVAGLFVCPSLAHASGCDEPKTGFDNVYCFARVYMDLDRQLNDNYTSLMRLIGPPQKAILRNGQRQWIVMRDRQCYSEDSKAKHVDMSCALSTTRQRIHFLSDRLAECRATGCNAGKLGRISEDKDYE